MELTDAANTGPVFDSVIVVTDRKVLDKQIRDNIKQFAHVKGVVEAITEGSKQLREALEEGKKVIVTTVQKFPFVVKEIQALGDKRFAILIDEAHSSQSGRAAAQMNVALAGTEDNGEEKDLEDRILEIIESQKLLKNASYFAFTATPKNRTLEAFGVKNPLQWQVRAIPHVHHEAGDRGGVHSRRSGELYDVLDVLQGLEKSGR